MNLPDLSRLKPADLESLKAALHVILECQGWVANERNVLSVEADYSHNIGTKKTKQLLAIVNGEINEVRATFGQPPVDVTVQTQIAS